ncbi:unnamed protein product [Rotaria sp. Silwood2]|nr:unnamed protein product [Rotaria sp. Silwood2]CAF2974180.1 unnamed protein product [Rotaria sp. Silwood2]CAF3443163.1 unnamed protein product [Rotaria sp. Silwood2]CAF3995766.1 unnamed protein product [Rotaria sp. Silwood2]CAF4240447.1 unnamed protein product [Rotaria sp. Silwood2]
MSNSIEQLELSAANAAVIGQFNEAIDIYSRIIQLATNRLNAHNTSLVFVRRAGYYIFSKRFEGNTSVHCLDILSTFSESLADSETTIGLDSNNILAYLQKA